MNSATLLVIEVGLMTLAAGYASTCVSPDASHVFIHVANTSLCILAENFLDLLGQRKRSF